MLLRLFHTLIHLRPVQIFYQLRYRLHRPLPHASGLPPRRQARGRPAFLTLHAPELVGPRRIRVLGDETEIPASWTRPDRSALWNYHVQYFDDLNAQDADARKEWHHALMESWIESNPPRTGVGWDAYPTALRIVNWVKWGFRHGLTDAAHESLAHQARVLAANFEYHLLANHLFADAKGLFFAGLWCGGQEGDAWLRSARALLAREIEEQILPDGGHYERSPMYHQTILVDLLDIDAACRGLQADPPHGLAEAIARMRAWSAWMSHPDGDIAFFNDACLGIAPGHAALEAALRAAPHDYKSVAAAETAHLPESGFWRLRSGPLQLLMDVGQIAPAYQPGHAHAESLCIEVSAFDHRLFVNSGVSEYGVSAERLRQRSTAAHNTASLGTHNSSEVWSGFRVARRARVQLIEHSADYVSASHGGYAHLGVTHVRRVTCEPGVVIVHDTLEGAQPDAAIVRWYLHPGVDLVQHSNTDLGLHIQDRALRFVSDVPIEIVASTWHPGQGEVVANRCILLQGPSNGTVISRLVWDDQGNAAS